jgi:serine/threonine-protein kinase
MSDESLPKPLRALSGAGSADPERMRETHRGPLDQDVPTGEEETVRGLVADRDPLIGTEVSGYLVKGRLGQGGMGIVYEGEQPLIGKRVAIKVLRPEVAEDPEVVKRLVAEARAVNQVGHRGIVDVFGFGQLPDGRHCMLMEYLEGESLEHVLTALREQHRIMPILETLHILDELLSALAAAHSAGVVHRDLKPSNIYLCTQRDGTRFVKVLDFGIAKVGVVGAAPSTNASLMVGTPAYMAPEQAGGGMVSPALDLYGVGCIAYELLTGHQPFTATSVVEMLLKHRDEIPARPSERVLSLPDVMDDFVMRLLQKKPADRYASADEARKAIAPLKKELSKSSARMPELAPKVSPSPSTKSEAPQVDATPAVLNQTDTQVSRAKPKRGSQLAYVGVFLLIALIAGGSVLTLGRNDEPIRKVIVPVMPEPASPLAVVPAPVPPVAQLRVGAVNAVPPEGTRAVQAVQPRTPLQARALGLLTRVSTVEVRLAKTQDGGLSSTVSRLKSEISNEASRWNPSPERLDTLESQLEGVEATSQ